VAALVYTFLARQLRDRDIRELLLLAEPVPADRALQMGLLSRVVSKDRLLDETLTLAATIAQGAPGALAATKRMLCGARPPSVEDDIQRAVASHLSARTGDEAAEGIAAFLEKRPPKWAPER
jgi:methylglutaconyl-CoA hydratase